MESRENLFKQYKKDWPQTVGETDKVFDNDNFIDWLCQQTKALTDEIEELKKMQQKAVDILCEADEEREKLQSRISELEKGNEWISVEYRLPEINEPILAFQKNNYKQFRKIIVGYDGSEFRPFYNGDDDDILFDGRSKYPKVTHWMPLPNNPKTN